MSVQDRPYMAEQLPPLAAAPSVTERIIEKEVRYKSPGLLGLLAPLLGHLVPLLLNLAHLWPVIPVVGAGLLWFVFGWSATPPGEKAAEPRGGGGIVNQAGAAARRVVGWLPSLGTPEQPRPDGLVTSLRAKLTGELAKADERERTRLAARCDRLGLSFDPALDTKTIREQVAAEEARLSQDADHQARLRAWKRAVERWEWERQHGVNAFCPDAKCRHPMRLGDERKGHFVCPKCNGHFPCSNARALFKSSPRPAEPLPSPPKKGLLKRVSGFLFG